MKKTYKIKYEPVVVNGKSIDKWNIEYYHEGVMVNREHWSYDGEGLPKEGVSLKEGYEKL